MKKIALVTGAAGALGPLLVDGLLKAGYLVKVLVRNKPVKNVFNDAVTIVTGDITNKEDVDNAVNGVNLVFHLAAKLHVNDPDPSLEKEYYRVNVDGTRLVTEACLNMGVARIIFFSTIAVYGDNNDKGIFYESSPLNPCSFYAESKKQAEDIVLKADTGIVLRVGAVYGSRMKGNYRTLFSAVQNGWFIPFGKGTNRRTLVFQDDLVRAAILVAEHPKAVGQVYNVTDGAVHTLDDILSAMYRAAGKSKPRVYLPEKTVRFMAGIGDRISSLAGRKQPILTKMVKKLFEDVAVGGEKIEKELEFKAEYNLLQGWLDTAASWDCKRKLKF